MEKKYVVYEHVSKDGKRYIGITSQILRKRWRNGEGYKNNIMAGIRLNTTYCMKT